MTTPRAYSDRLPHRYAICWGQALEDLSRIPYVGTSPPRNAGSPGSARMKSLHISEHRVEIRALNQLLNVLDFTRPCPGPRRDDGSYVTYAHPGI